MAEWLRRLTRKPKVRTAVVSNPMLDSLVAIRNASPGQPEPFGGNLVAVAGSCGGLMVKHSWFLLEISLSDFRGLATLNISTYLPREMDWIGQNQFNTFIKEATTIQHNNVNDEQREVTKADIETEEGDMANLLTEHDTVDLDKYVSTSFPRFHSESQRQAFNHITQSLSIGK